MAGGAGESNLPKLDTVAQVDRQALVGFGAFPPRPTGGRRSLASEMRRQPGGYHLSFETRKRVELGSLPSAAPMQEPL